MDNYVEQSGLRFRRFDIVVKHEGILLLSGDPALPVLLLHQHEGVELSYFLVVCQCGHI